MTESQNNIKNNSPASPQNLQETNFYEDEINLIDYFLVIWKRRYLILLGSIIPTVVAGLFFLQTPRNYKVTYVYDIGELIRGDVHDRDFSEKNYKQFLGVFYDQKNTSRIITKLPDFDPHSVEFEVWPSYIDLSETRIINAEQLEQIHSLTANLLYMAIVYKNREKLFSISSVVRDNFENIIPLYYIEQQLVESIRQTRSKLAKIEEGKFSLKLSLEKNTNILARLKKITTNGSDQNRDSVTLQFDMGAKTEYLPLGYQIQAAESRIVELQEEIDTNEKLYGYHKKLLNINNKILEYLQNKSANYTIVNFHAFLTSLAEKCADAEQAEYLSSYIKDIENRMSTNVPVAAQPEITNLPRGTVKKSGIVFAIALMLSIFAGFLMEGLQKRTGQLS